MRRILIVVVLVLAVVAADRVSMAATRIQTGTGPPIEHLPLEAGTLALFGAGLVVLALAQQLRGRS
jgi:hypothetical protein